MYRTIVTVSMFSHGQSKSVPVGVNTLYRVTCAQRDRRDAGLTLCDLAVKSRMISPCITCRVRELSFLNIIIIVVVVKRCIKSKMSLM